MPLDWSLAEEAQALGPIFEVRCAIRDEGTSRDGPYR